MYTVHTGTLIPLKTILLNNVQEKKVKKNTFFSDNNKQMQQYV